jgi:histidinol-phosphate aminotransferase
VTSPADRIPVRADLADLEPYGAPQLDVPVRLNTNETAEPPPDGYLQAVADRILGLELNRYPDRRHERLRALLGARVGLPTSRVWAANGSNEVLAQLFQAYGGPGRRIATVRPGYSMYPVLARVTMTELVEVDLDEEFRWTDDVVAGLAATEPSIVILANPNNPTGVPVDIAYVRALHDATPGALIIADEAYVEFAGDASGDTVSAVGLLDELPRLVISRTFSKAFRLAGLRMGYLYGQDWVIDDIRRVRLPYHLDALKQAAAEVALEQEDMFLEHRGRVASERDRVHDALAAMPGVHVWPSTANFLLFRVAEAARVFDALLDHGVLVRDFSTKPRLGGCLRVTIGTTAENDQFLDALAAVLGH